MQFKNLYVVINPVGGHSDPDTIEKSLDELQEKFGWKHEVYLTTGKDGEDVPGLTRKACQAGADLVVAAGGDGTVQAVTNGLIGTSTPLAIIPAGTGNGLARALGIPLNLTDAINLLGGDNFRIQTIDAMRVDDRYFVLNVSAGISSHSMEDTPRDAKRRLGLIAYAQTILKKVVDPQPIRFNLVLDGHSASVMATEVLIANGEFLKEPPYIFGDPKYLNDGKFEVNVLTADSITEYLSLAWSLLLDRNEEQSRQQLLDLYVHERARIEVEGDPVPVQGDGEIIGETPVDVALERNALEILVPVPD